MNLAIRRFSVKLINEINSEPLPIEVKRLVIKDILSQLESETDKVLNAELELEKEKKESEVTE